MLVLELLRSGLNAGIDGFGAVGHFGDFFQYNRVMNGLIDVYKRQFLYCSLLFPSAS